MIISAAEVTSAEAISTSPTTQPAHIRQLHIRSLAASCAACHGTNGNSAAGNSTTANSTNGYSAGSTSSPSSIPSISNIDKPTFIAQMMAFRSGERPATVMHRHAKGLTIQEIENLAEYFSTQPRQPVSAIRPQNLSADYPN